MSLNADLRTDACPSPPRDEEPIDDLKFNVNNQDVKPEEHKYQHPKVKSKARTRPTKTANYASMITINNSSGVHIGTYNRYVYNANAVPKDAKEDENGVADNTDVDVKNERVEKLLASAALVEREHIFFVSGHMTSEGWQDFAKYLHFSNGQIDQLHTTYHSRGIKEVFYQLLLDWKQNDPNIATLGKLSAALWNNKQRDAVRRLADLVLKESP